MGRSRNVLLGGAALWISTALLGCEADLESSCVGGDGSCDQHEVSTATGTTSVGGGPVCYEGCDTDSASGLTGEYPCEVDAILDNCRRCHTDPTKNGAPFSLETYQDSQQTYFGVAIWARMQAVVSQDIMPAQDPKLTALEKFQLLDAWACQCAPPRDPAATCP